jgi:hypothetical protein
VAIRSMDGNFLRLDSQTNQITANSKDHFIWHKQKITTNLSLFNNAYSISITVGNSSTNNSTNNNHNEASGRKKYLGSSKDGEMQLMDDPFIWLISPTSYKWPLLIGNMYAHLEILHDWETVAKLRLGVFV